MLTTAFMIELLEFREKESLRISQSGPVAFGGRIRPGRNGWSLCSK